MKVDTIWFFRAWHSGYAFLTFTTTPLPFTVNCGTVCTPADYSILKQAHLSYDSPQRKKRTMNSPHPFDRKINGLLGGLFTNPKGSDRWVYCATKLGQLLCVGTQTVWTYFDECSAIEFAQWINERVEALEVDNA